METGVYEGKAVVELVRVTRQGGCIVITTLNSLSPWAEKRYQKAKYGHSLLQNISFRSPENMGLLVPKTGVIQPAI